MVDQISLTGNADFDRRCQPFGKVAHVFFPRFLVGDFAGLEISDNGTGMSSEVIGRAFEPFFTTKGPGKGTGLGLSMVYGFTRQSGGSALIRSEIGRGTTVTLFLPRSRNARSSAEERTTDLPVVGSA